MNKITFSLALSSCVLMTSCATPLNSAGPGWVFTEVTEGVQVNNNVAVSKRGETCEQNILGIVSTGDSTIDTTKRNSQITNVATIDRYYWSILGVYAKACTKIAGN